MKVQTKFFGTLKYKHDLMPLINIKVQYDLSNHLGSTEILCSFRFVLEGKKGKEMPESSRLEFLEKFCKNKSLRQFCFIRCRRQHHQVVE